jgi:hypothetical protein
MTRQAEVVITAGDAGDERESFFTPEALLVDYDAREVRRLAVPAGDGGTISLQDNDLEGMLCVQASEKINMTPFRYLIGDSNGISGTYGIATRKITFSKSAIPADIDTDNEIKYAHVIIRQGGNIFYSVVSEFDYDTGEGTDASITLPDSVSGLNNDAVTFCVLEIGLVTRTRLLLAEAHPGSIYLFNPNAENVNVVITSLSKAAD